MEYKVIGKHLNLGDGEPTLVSEIPGGMYYLFTRPNGDVDKWSIKVTESALANGTWKIINFEESIKAGDSFIFSESTCNAQSNLTIAKVYKVTRDNDDFPDRVYFINDENEADWQYKICCRPVLTKHFGIHGAPSDVPANWQSYDPYAENYTTKQEEEMTNCTVGITVPNEAYIVTETITVYGQRIETLTDEDVYNALRRIAVEQFDLAALKCDGMSERIAYKTKYLETAKLALCDLLDEMPEDE
jgi:hypothetical protein